MAQVCVIFTLPERFPQREPLAYIEYFTPFGAQQKFSDLYSVKRSYKSSNRSVREAAVISLESIRCSCHLIPNFGAVGATNNNDKTQSTSSSMDSADNALEKYQSFFVNPYLDVDTFQMFLG